MPDPAADVDQPVTLVTLVELVSDAGWVWAGTGRDSHLRAPDGHRFWLRARGRASYLCPMRDFAALRCPGEREPVSQ